MTSTLDPYDPHPFDDPGGPEAGAIRRRWREDYGWRIGLPQPEDRSGHQTLAGHAADAAILDALHLVATDPEALTIGRMTLEALR